MKDEVQNDIKAQLDTIQTKMGELCTQMAEMRTLLGAPRENRESYSVEEVAAMLGKSAYTVREWCREGRINATKRAERRGAAELWSISGGEVARYKDGGLLSLQRIRLAG